MQQGIKNSYAWYVTALLLAIAIITAAEPAFAQATTNDPPVTIANTGEICPNYPGFVNRMIACIGETVIWSVQKHLGAYNTGIIQIIRALFVLAIIMYGILLFMGRGNIAVRDGIMLAIKIGFITWLVINSEFGKLFPYLLGMINWTVGLVTSYVTTQLNPYCGVSQQIWLRVDCVLGLLIGGIIPGIGLSSGLIGFLGAALFSGGTGLALFLLGLGILLVLGMALFQAAFILVSSYIALALLAIVAPLMIPLILFQVTSGYFQKWVRLLIGVILQPIFLFAYLSILLIALDVAILSGPYSVYRSLTCSDPDLYQHQIGTYMLGSSVYVERSGLSAIESFTVNQQPGMFKSKYYPKTSSTVQSGVQGKVNTWDTGAAVPDNAQAPGAEIFQKGNIAIDIPTTGIYFEELAARCGFCDAQAFLPGNEQALFLCTLQYFLRVLISFITAVVVVYIFYTMLQFIPYLSTLISSDLFALPSFARINPTDGMQMNKLKDWLGKGK